MPVSNSPKTGNDRLVLLARDMVTMGYPTTLRIIACILYCRHGHVTQGMLEAVLDLKRSKIIQHLDKLTRAGIVKASVLSGRKGLNNQPRNFYSLVEGRFAPFAPMMDELFKLSPLMQEDYKRQTEFVVENEGVICRRKK